MSFSTHLFSHHLCLSNNSLFSHCWAAQINTELCDRFSVGHYPMLFWGAPSKFVAAGPKPILDKNEILGIDDGRTADRLLNWINKQLGRHVTHLLFWSTCIVDAWFSELLHLDLLFIWFWSLIIWLCSSYGLEDEKFENEHLQSNVSDLGQVFQNKSITHSFSFGVFKKKLLCFLNLEVIFVMLIYGRLYALYTMLRKQHQLPLTSS